MSDPSPSSLPPGYFEDVYGANADPWNFAASPYEAAKYDATLAALPRAMYPRAFEAGCSIGVLTARLANRCDSLLAAEGNETALAQARERCVALGNVRLERRWLPGEFPTGTFDLILVSEMGYYLSLPDLYKLRAKCVSQLALGGHLLLVHWTPLVHDYPLTGDQVHEAFFDSPLRHLSGRREEKYRLDLFERPDAGAT